MMCVLIRLALINNCLILKKIVKMSKLCFLTRITPQLPKLPVSTGSHKGVQAIKVQLYLLVYMKRFYDFFRLCLHYNLYHNIPKIMINLIFLKEVLYDITS